MKNITQLFALLAIGSAIGFSSCSSQSPATRYAREHSDREFTSWKAEHKKTKKAQRSRVKEHTKNKHTW